MRATSAAAALLALLGGACAPAVTPVPARPPAASGLLAAQRIAALPAPQRTAWSRYLARSAELRARDRALLEGELRASGRDAPPPAPQGAALVVDDRDTPPEWYAGEEARRIADAIVSFQTPSGGWSKRLALDAPRQPGMSFSAEGNGYIATFDNDATTEQIRFLLRAARATGDARYRDAARRGVHFVLDAQFPNGCWPQVYPLQGGYHDAATLNDDAMVNVLRTLREVEADTALEPALRERAHDSFRRGVYCLLDAQIVQDGRLTVWGAQHDPLTLEPVGARAYEHASLSGRESAAVLLLMMEIPDPDPRVVAAVQGGVEWLRRNAIHGYQYQAKGDLVEQEGAGPLWARFYELGTNRPIFSNRDGVVRYRWDELVDERKFGYAWYTDEPARVLSRYPRWARRHRLTTPAAG